MALTDTLHIETVSADKRHVEAVMPITPEVFQPHGTCTAARPSRCWKRWPASAPSRTRISTRSVPSASTCRFAIVKAARRGTLRGVATSTAEEVSERTGAVKQYWNVAAYDDAGDVVSDGVIMTKIVSLARLAQKEQERTS